MQRLFIDRVDFLRHPGGVALHEILNQHENVVFPMSEGRHLNGKHVQPVEQVAPECPIRDGCLQIAIRRGDNANVDTDGLAASNSLEFPFLQDSQKSHLHIG